MGHPAELTNGKFTYADYLTWPEEERWELIYGEAFAMTPGPSRIHQGILVCLVSSFHQQLAGQACKVYCAPFDVRLANETATDQDTDTVVQPDLLVVRDSSKLDERGCKGAPDLVVEIVSPSSGTMDQKIKFALYEKAGVKEYWIVYPAEKIVMVFTLGENSQYGRPSVYSQEDKIAVPLLGAVTIDLGPVFAE